MIHSITWNKQIEGNLFYLNIKNTVKPVTQPAGYTRFHGLEGRVKPEGGLY